MKKVIIFGSGGQARVVASILLANKKYQLVGFVDPFAKHPQEKIFGLPIRKDYKGTAGFIVGIGNNQTRAKRFKQLKKLGLKPIVAIHPTADIGRDVIIGDGTVVNMGAIIATQVIIGQNCIINSGAIVEHEDKIGNHVHIAPGVALAGRVVVKDYAFLGIRSVVKDYQTIGKKAVVGAGAVVVKDVPDNITVVGIPARSL